MTSAPCYVEQPGSASHGSYNMFDWRGESIELFDLRWLFHSISKECCLVLTVVEQNVKGHFLSHHVIDGLFHDTVEISCREGVIQHVVNLKSPKMFSLECWIYTHWPCGVSPCTSSPAAPWDLIWLPNVGPAQRVGAWSQSLWRHVILKGLKFKNKQWMEVYIPLLKKKPGFCGIKKWVQGKSF